MKGKGIAIDSMAREHHWPLFLYRLDHLRWVHAHFQASNHGWLVTWPSQVNLLWWSLNWVGHLIRNASHGGCECNGQPWDWTKVISGDRTSIKQVISIREASSHDQSLRGMRGLVGGHGWETMWCIHHRFLHQVLQLPWFGLISLLVPKPWLLSSLWDGHYHIFHGKSCEQFEPIWLL